MGAMAHDLGESIFGNLVILYGASESRGGRGREWLLSESPVLIVDASTMHRVADGLNSIAINRCDVKH